MHQLFAILSMTTPAAMAQAPGDFQLHGAAVLEPNPAITFMSESISNPAVAYDSVRDRYVMVFEARTPTVDALCPQGVWALGYATSPDGLVWTPGSAPLVEPSPGSGTFWECVAAHPNVIFNAAANGGNGRLTIWFKGEADTSVCPTTDACDDQYRGVGKARINYNLDGTIDTVAIRASRVLPITGENFGYPHVVQNNGTFYMLLGKYPDIFLATGATPNSFTLEPDAVLEVSEYSPSVSWVQDEFFNPAITCEDSFAFPYAAFVGGRNTDFGTVINGGWGKAISSTGITWVLGVDPFFEWSSDLDWRHWDMLRVSGNDYLVWYDQKDGAGNLSIFFASTLATWNNADVYSKACP